jgi:putative spermidine/putrescine transport system permease protein
MTWLDRPATDTQITHRSRLWLYGLVIVLFAFLILPTLVVIPMSFSKSQYLEFPPRHFSLRWYEAYFHSRAWMQATATSFKAAGLTVVVATPLGTIAAYGLYNAELAIARLVSLLLITPIMIPIILVGTGIFYAYVKLKIVNTLIGIVLAHSILAIPVVIMIVTSALKSFDMSQERVARSLGASRVQAFFMIVMPQIKFAVLTAAVLSFLTSFDEVVVSLFVSGGDNSTLTRIMFTALRDQIDPTIAAISTIMIVTTSLLLGLSQVFARREKR